MQEQLNTFIAQFNGRSVDYDHVYGSQCVDLVKAWEDWIDCPITNGNAKDQFKDWAGYTRITNTITAVPQPGDIIIWGTKIGQWGHIAVFVSGNAISFKSFDQNWPVGSVCKIVSHSYNGVLGWLRPNKSKGKYMIPKNYTNNELYMSPQGHVLWHPTNPDIANEVIGDWSGTKPLSSLVPPEIRNIPVPNPVNADLENSVKDLSNRLLLLENDKSALESIVEAQKGKLSEFASEIDKKNAIIMALSTQPEVPPTKKVVITSEIFKKMLSTVVNFYNSIRINKKG